MLRLEIGPSFVAPAAKEKGLHVRPCSPEIMPADFSVSNNRAWIIPHWERLLGPIGGSKRRGDKSPLVPQGKREAAHRSGEKAVSDLKSYREAEGETGGS